MTLFSTYLTLTFMFVMVLFPLLVPLGITGVHACLRWLRAEQPARPLISFAVPAAA
jgi:hypothetical protein